MWGSLTLALLFPAVCYCLSFQDHSASHSPTPPKHPKSPTETTPLLTSHHHNCSHGDKKSPATDIIHPQRTPEGMTCSLDSSNTSQNGYSRASTSDEVSVTKLTDSQQAQKATNTELKNPTKVRGWIALTIAR